MNWLRHLFSRRRRYDELSESIREHLDEKIADLMDRGMTREEATRSARREFGNVNRIEERSREVWQWPTLESIWADIKYAIRQFIKSPAFAITAVLTLALGIGANSAIFSLIDAVLIRRLPVMHPETLIRIGDDYESGVGYGVPKNADYSVFSTYAWEELRKNASEFQDLAAMESGGQTIIARAAGSQQPAHSFTGEFVSGNYFQTFGLIPAIGRLFTDADNKENAPTTAVMSYDAWKNRYAADPAVVGSTFYINSRPVIVIGVAPQGFFGDRLSATPPDFYLPIESAPLLVNASWVHDPNANWLDIIGRVKPGVSLPALQQKLSGLVREALAPIDTFTTAGNKPLLLRVHVALTSGSAGIRKMQQQYSSQLYLLMAVSGLVLIMACANVANLLLVRGMARKTELCVRCALGAGRIRLIQQLVTESLILALLGGIAGIAVAYGGTRVLLALAFPDTSNLPIHANPSPAVMLFAIALSIVTGIFFGVAPVVMAARTQPIDALRTGVRSVSGGATLLQRGLIVIQTTLSVVLLIAAGLFAQSLNHLQHADLKLVSNDRYIVHIDPQAAGYLPSQVGPLYRGIEQRLHQIPDILKVGISTYAPMEDQNSSWGVQVQGHPNLHVHASYVKINPEYFDAVGTHLLRGRSIGQVDTPTSRAVAVVNQSFVKRLFEAGENPIGQHFGTSPGTDGDYEIVGVVEDTVYTDVRLKDHAMYFLPILQRAPSDKTPIDRDDDLYANAIVLETTHPIDNMESLVRHALADINSNLAVVKFETFQEQIADQFTDDRMIARLTLFFGALSLLLTMIGLYGVTSYSVSRRAGEIGIRMALGAERARVVSMVIWGALVQAVLGLAIGLPCAVLCVRFVEAMLYDVKDVNATITFATILSLLLTGCIAALIPARKAASVDPVQALRSE
jgi:macrolide transport system ATP-binding/permease protein